MTDKEKKLTAAFLELASNEFAEHGFNDVDEEMWEGWTLEERQTFIKEYHQWNGDPEEYDPNFLNLPDWAIMAFLAAKVNPEK